MTFKDDAIQFDSAPRTTHIPSCSCDYCVVNCCGCGERVRAEDLITNHRCPEELAERLYQRRAARRELAQVRQLIDFKGHFDRDDNWQIEPHVIKRKEVNERLAAIAQGKCPAMYAVAVRTTRHCGGAEEGGWWYDWSTIEEVRRAYTFRQLLLQVRKLRDEHPTSRYGRHSCADTRGDVTIFMMRSEDLIEGLQSTERPRYE